MDVADGRDLGTGADRRQDDEIAVGGHDLLAAADRLADHLAWLCRNRLLGCRARLVLAAAAGAEDGEPERHRRIVPFVRAVLQPDRHHPMLAQPLDDLGQAIGRLGLHRRNIEDQRRVPEEVWGVRHLLQQGGEEGRILRLKDLQR